MIEAHEVITGERLQALAEITVATDPILAFHRSLPGSGVRRVLRAAGTMTALAAGTDVAPLHGHRSIFVYSHLLASFCETLLPRLRTPFVLISHNSDEAVDERFRAALDDPRILHWFAQNARLDHPKLTALPIGLANAQWPHGDIAALMAAGARSGPREAALYLNFDVRTNPAVRAPLLAALRHRPFVRLGRPLPYPAYLAEMAGHHFCLSPPGNGLDCHRTWECLYLGVVPVVRRGDGDALLSGLPVIACDDLAGLDAETLARGWRALAGRVFDDRPLRLSTWRARIAAAAGA